MSIGKELKGGCRDVGQGFNHHPFIVRCLFIAALSQAWALPWLSLGGGVVHNCTESELRTALTGGGAVTFACDGTIFLGSPILISAQTTLDGRGHQVTISGGQGSGILQVGSNVTFTMIQVNLVNGRSQNGGAINNEGTVNATNCAFLGNVAVGTNGINFGDKGGSAMGGAIRNLGVLNLSACTFLTNSVFGGMGVSGIINQQYAIPTMPGGAGGVAYGGAICSVGVLTMERCLLASNSVTGGVGGRGSDYSVYPVTPPYEASDGGAGGGGMGGALYSSGTANVVNCTFAGNKGNGGGGGLGGRKAPSIVGGDYGRWGGDGGQGVGAIHGDGTVGLVNCTLAWNVGIGGWGGNGGAANVQGRGGYGGGGVGAFFRSNGVASVVNCIADSNTGTGGLGGYGCQGHSYDRWCGNFPTGVVASSFGGPILDQGHNLSSDNSYFVTNSTSIKNIRAVLAALADNGGPNPTLALSTGSPAIDAADGALAPPVDQRGFRRPLGPASDIGAFEYGYPGLLKLNPVPDGVNVMIYGACGQTCRLFCSPDLSHWTALVTNQIGLDGTVLYRDKFVPGMTSRFYRLSFP